MSVRINELQEFVYEPAFDPEANRAKVYASCRNVDAARFRRDLDKESAKPTQWGVRTCPECGSPFSPRQHNQFFCSASCRKADYNRKRREESAKRREAGL